MGEGACYVALLLIFCCDVASREMFASSLVKVDKAKQDCCMSRYDLAWLVYWGVAVC